MPFEGTYLQYVRCVLRGGCGPYGCSDLTRQEFKYSPAKRSSREERRPCGKFKMISERSFTHGGAQYGTGDVMSENRLTWAVPYNTHEFFND